MTTRKTATAPRETVEAADTRPVDFYGREIQVRRPTVEQVAVWQRVAKRFGGLDKDAMDTMAAMRALDQALRIIESVLAEEDMDWLEDQLMSGLLKLDKAMEVLGLAAAAWREEAPAPKTGPAPRARRR